MGLPRCLRGAPSPALYSVLALVLLQRPALGIRVAAGYRGEASLHAGSEEAVGAFSERFLGLRMSVSRFLAEAANVTAQDVSACAPLASLNYTNITKDPKLASAFCAAPKELQGLIQNLIAENRALKGKLTQAAADVAQNEALKRQVQQMQEQVAASMGLTSNISTTTRLLWHGPPPPPPCGPAPQPLDSASVSMGLAPFKPIGAVGNVSATRDGGLVWKLVDGGWAFQYPDMLAHVEQDGRTLMAWAKKGLSVDMHEGGITYHHGDTVVHRDIYGRVVYDRPAGTIHQAGSTLIYHWCNPNMIIYHTPAGIVYYDSDGMTYRGHGVAHYATNGEVLYQGESGITHLYPNGAVTHWTSSGAIYRHADGMTTYTPTGESTPQVLPTDALGGDPFPGPPLTMEQVLDLASKATLPTMPPPPPPRTTTPAPKVLMNHTNQTNATPACPPCANSSLGPPPPLPVRLMTAMGVALGAR